MAGIRRGVRALGTPTRPGTVAPGPPLARQADGGVISIEEEEEAAQEDEQDDADDGADHDVAVLHRLSFPFWSEAGGLSMAAAAAIPYCVDDGGNDVADVGGRLWGVVGRGMLLA